MDLWKLLRPDIEARLAVITEGIVNGKAEREYLLACGEVQGLRYVIAEAKALAKKLNNGEIEED